MVGSRTDGLTNGWAAARDGLLPVLAIVLAVAMIASLPDFGEPTIVPFAALIGAFLGAALARVRGFDRERGRDLTEDVAFLATGSALAAYVFGLVTGLY